MREIKFRLIKDNNIIGYENHMKCMGGIQIEYSFDNTWGNPIGYIVHDHKDQYTGRKDKNNVEIYEGDNITVLQSGKHGIEKNTYTIKWDNKCSCFGLWQEKYNSFSWFGFSIIQLELTEVIGNIYENPEKIKVEK